MKIEAIFISAALPGAQPWKGFRPPRPSIWLVETEIVPVLEEQYFIAQTAGQIAARMLGVKSENYFTKMMISRDPVDGFC